MCGRFALFASMEAVQNAFGLGESISMLARYNISPEEMIPVVLPEGKLQFMRWGFLPQWSRSVAMKKMINARIEAILEKPMFRDSIKRYRCIVPMSGYYEWRKIGNLKQPFFISSATDAVLAMAAIWSPSASAADALSKGGVAIVTTAAIHTLSHIHDRMPLILTSEQIKFWLSKQKTETILSACQQTNLSFSVYPVTRQVNNPAYEDPLCALPLNE